MTAPSLSAALVPSPLSGAASVDLSAASTCTHCGQPRGSSAVGEFCCQGCRAVHDALFESGLARFYDLRGAQGEPVGELKRSAFDSGFVDSLERTIQAQTYPQRIALSLQGARCAACVWVLEQLFTRLPGALRIEVSVATGTLALLVRHEFPIRRYIDEVQAVGYRLGPRARSRAGTGETQTGDALLLRLGICTALALNAMAFSAAIHLGLPAGALRELLSDLSFVSAMLSVLVGGPVFFGSAWRSLRAGVLHLDLPIATGIALTTLAATWSYFGDHAQAAYFDSLAAFVALMLAGRYVQERAVARSRAELLDDPGVGALYCRRELGTVLETARCSDLQADDILLIPPGELLPVRAELLSQAASCSLAWIDGESQPRPFAQGEPVPSGAFNIGDQALRARALESFAESDLLNLLRPSASEHTATRHLNRFAGFYVVAVLLLATLGLVGYVLLTGDLTRGLAVATAICVVTCPCAIGIAVPLAYEIAHTKLRRRGVFVRSGTFLDRALDLRRVVFDKTGTLTTGRLNVANADALMRLSQAAQSALYQLCARSVHPKSLAIRDALSARSLPYRSELTVTERIGLGVEASIDGRHYRLGRSAWAAPSTDIEGALCFSVDGELLATIETAETFLADAKGEVSALRSAGYDVFILSGDSPDHVHAAAMQLDIEDSHVLGGCSPSDKAAWIGAHDPEHTLMVGDGINDALAMQAALCGATPAIDRPFLPARTDFYFTTPGLSAISTALQAAKNLSSVVRTNLRFAIAYNVIAVSVALAGYMQPWLAAIVMPLSSLVVVLRTSSAMSRSTSRPKEPAWKS